MKKIVLILILIISCKSKKEAEIKPFQQLSSLVDNYAENTLQKENINSIALAIYRNGEVYYNFYGELDKGKKNTPNNNTLYEIASITKVFTGSLAAKAVLENKIRLEDDIRKYLEGDYSNLEFENIPITISNLLTHSLGFKTKHPKRFSDINDKIAEGYYKDKEIDYNFNDFLDDLKLMKLDKKPGTYFEYNNVGSELMAYILQKVYQKKYKEIVYSFLKELEMNNTYLIDFDKHKHFLANGYDEQNKLAPYYKNPLLGGAGGMISTLPDLIKLLKFQLESKNPLIKEATRVLFKDEEGTQMGYLWQDLGTAKEEGFYYSKTGNSIGIHSGILICPDSNYGQIMIVNNNSDAASNDYFNLFYTIETDLIKFPKINLKSYIKPKLLVDKKAAKKEFNQLKINENKYFNTNFIFNLNAIGYELLKENKIKKAIEVFQFAISENPKNANLHDSLGQAYFENKDFEKSKKSYLKSLKLNPKNENAEKYLKKINHILNVNSK
ncbi:serine hydrolase domain-containing protein [Polaribacter porphyrae]|uniref:Beta-lactamase-related domain-containing protein n=1 Tax=Polaribacter porphyrae TaxID=1137780 RepID=A0A2S7WR84_9FLAO|nr:serine hydrolase domain-containing protein [Polaribacter porphyrae]PQJ80100.1 hypothetical protein BTO18_13360 [Polaribacter porphyrae]